MHYREIVAKMVEKVSNINIRKLQGRQLDPISHQVMETIYEVIG